MIGFVTVFLQNETQKTLVVFECNSIKKHTIYLLCCCASGQLSRNNVKKIGKIVLHLASPHAVPKVLNQILTSIMQQLMGCILSHNVAQILQCVQTHLAESIGSYCLSMCFFTKRNEIQHATAHGKRPLTQL